MTDKIHNLTLHKNTLAEKKQRQLRKSFLCNARTMAKDKTLGGYVIISWDKDGVPNTAWRAGHDSAIPAHLLPAYADSVLTKMLAKKDE